MAAPLAPLSTMVATICQWLVQLLLALAATTNNPPL